MRGRNMERIVAFRIGCPSVLIGEGYKVPHTMVCEGVSLLRRILLLLGILMMFQVLDRCLDMQAVGS